MRRINHHLQRSAVQLLVTLTLLSSASAASKLTISPNNARQLSNSTLQFTASVNGEVLDGPVNWTSSNTAVAAIAGTTGTAKATLLSAGTTTITATHGGQEASTVVTVTVAVSPAFTVQPTDTNVSAVIDPAAGIKVQLLDNLGDPLPSQSITVSIGTNAADGGGAVQNAQGTLSGTLTQTTNSSGIATFADLKIDWLGNGYRLVASANPSSGTVSGTSNAFNELRVGDACLGPTQPACSSGCADTDLDGLNDAWEKAGGVDLNGDGLITDSYHDVLLPGADPNKPDIYLKYDYMFTTTTSPFGIPPHTHKPPDRAWDQMRAMFAAHGITLHVLAPAAGIPEHLVTTLDPNAASACAGNDFITMKQLRAQYFGNLRPAYHYMVFAHDSTTPSNGTLVANCSEDALCHGLPSGGASGVSDLPGNDSIVSFGAYVDANLQIGIELWSSTMMHELGHNFGLVHGSLADPGNANPAAQKCMNFKPNYISVMNYTYQLASIVPVTAPGTIMPIACTSDADCGPPTIIGGRCSTPNTCFCTDDLTPGSLNPGGNVCYRPDYARDDLLNLNEIALDENVGVGGRADLDDIVWYFNSGGTLPGPGNGSPIDWDNNGVIQNLTTCVNALPPGQGPTGHCPDINDDGLNNDQMNTTADWTQVNGQLIHFNFQFQCTAGFQNDGATPSFADQQTASSSPPEVSFEWARQHHLLHPPRVVSISVSPKCSAATKPIAAGQPGRVQVAVLGAHGFDVSQIETSSLDLHGAEALAVSVQDVNGDGRPDLVAIFDSSSVKLHSRATVARVRGWLSNGQSFSGEDKIRLVPSLAGEDPSCR